MIILIKHHPFSYKVGMAHCRAKFLCYHREGFHKPHQRAFWNWGFVRHIAVFQLGQQPQSVWGGSFWDLTTRFSSIGTNRVLGGESALGILRAERNFYKIGF